MKNELFKNVTFTPDDLHTLFGISESLETIKDNVSKYDAIADILYEALASFDETGAVPTDDTTLFYIAWVLKDYSCKVKSELRSTYEIFSNLFTEKKQISTGGALI